MFTFILQLLLSYLLFLKASDFVVCKASCAHGACTTYLPTHWVILFKTPSWPLVLYMVLWQQQFCLLDKADVPHVLLRPFCMLPKQHFVWFCTQTRSRPQSYRIYPWDPHWCSARSAASGMRPWAGLVPSMASGCRACSHSHPKRCLLLLLCPFPSPGRQGTPGTVETGLSTQGDVAKGCVCVVHGSASCSVQTALVSSTKISPQRKVWGQCEWKYLCKLA